MFSLFQSLRHSDEETTEYSSAVSGPLVDVSGGRIDDNREAPETLSKGQSWSDAHDSYCRKHHVLRASIQKVLHEACGEGQEIPWELPSPHVVTTDSDITKVLMALSESSASGSGSIGSNAPATSATLSSSFYSITTTVTQGIVSRLLSVNGEDGEPSNWRQTQDDALSQTQHVELEIPVVHVALTSQCLKKLHEQLLSAQQSQFPFLLAKSAWHKWCSEVLILGEQEKALSSTDTNWLLQLLLAEGGAKVIDREVSPDLIAFGDYNEEELRVRVASWDLQCAKAQIEQKLLQWTQHVNECSRKAIEFKRDNQKSQALAQLSRKKLLQDHIDTSSQTLIKLEQTQAALETAHSNKTMLEVLSESSRVLKELSSQTTVEQISKVNDDLSEELDNLQELQGALASTQPDIDEGELLAELQRLAIETSAPPVVESPVASKAVLGQPKRGRRETVTPDQHVENKGKLAVPAP